MQNLVPLAVALGKAMGRKNPVNRKTCQDFLKQHDIAIAGLTPMGRGVSWLITEEVADEVCSMLTPVTAPLEEPESSSEIHIGRLEAKCDRIEQSLNELQSLTKELIKANNVLADKQAKVLSSLGAA